MVYRKRERQREGAANAKDGRKGLPAPRRYSEPGSAPPAALPVADVGAAEEPSAPAPAWGLYDENGDDDNGGAHRPWRDDEGGDGGDEGEDDGARPELHVSLVYRVSGFTASAVHVADVAGGAGLVRVLRQTWCVTTVPVAL